MTSDQNHDEPDRAPPPDPARPEAARDLTDQPETLAANPEPEHGPRIWPRVVGVLILLLGAGGAWIWQNPGFLQNTVGSMFSASPHQDTEAARIDALEARVARLEQRPPAADPNAVNQRLDQLEKRIAGVSSPDPRAVEARLTALEARGAAAGQATPSAAAPAEPNLAPVLARLDALEKTVAREPIKVDAVEAKVDALSARDPNADLRGRVDDVTRQLDDLKASTSKQTREANHADRLAGLDIALASGHPLGAIPNAPPALTRFATVAPPTEAALRLSFPAAAREALKVSRPDTEGKPFLDRVMARLQDFKLITVREGDRVLIGNAAGATLGHAQVLLEAGDLAGAARTVATLTGPPAEKMAAWLADANALVAAREALATLAGNG